MEGRENLVYLACEEKGRKGKEDGWVCCLEAEIVFVGFAVVLRRLSSSRHARALRKAEGTDHPHSSILEALSTALAEARSRILLAPAPAASADATAAPPTLLPNPNIPLIPRSPSWLLYCCWACCFARGPSVAVLADDDDDAEEEEKTVPVR
jgi:hypothetical protein